MDDNIRDIILCYLHNTEFNSILLNGSEQIKYWYKNNLLQATFFTYLDNCNGVHKQQVSGALDWHRTVKWGEQRGFSTTVLKCICPEKIYLSEEPKCMNRRCEAILKSFSEMTKAYDALMKD